MFFQRATNAKHEFFFQNYTKLAAGCSEPCSHNIMTPTALLHEDEDAGL